MNKDVLSTYSKTGTSARLPIISKFGLLCSVLFMVFSLAGRFLYPFGDEPDFAVRAPKVLFDPQPWWSPYSVFEGLFHSLDYQSNCVIAASPLSLWAHVDAISCSEPLQQIMIRFLLTMLIVVPLLVAIIFRRFFLRWVALFSFKWFGARRSNAEWNLRLDALALSILMPSVIYSLGVFAEEQLVLLLGLLLSMLVGQFFLVGMLFLLILVTDTGNGALVLGTLGFLWAHTLIEKRFGFRILSMVLLAQTAFAFFMGFYVLNYLSALPFLADKADAMYDALSTGYQVDKYPVILRPVITFMSGVFGTPGFLKVVPLYIIFGLAFSHMLRSLRVVYKNYQSTVSATTATGKLIHQQIVQMLSGVSTILFFVFLFPTYSNAKYYLFLMPLILGAALLITTRERLLLLFTTSSLTVLIFLALFRG